MGEIERIKKEKIKKIIEKKMETEIEVNDSNFQEKVIGQSKKIPIVADFWASWCQSCLMLSPILEKLAKEYEGKFILAKVNVDEAREAAQRHNVMSIPAVKLFKDEKIIAEFIGVRPEPMIKQWLDKNI